MRKVFVDLGAWTGDTIEEFYKREVIWEDDLENYEVYAFEPHPVFFWQMSQKIWSPQVHLFEAAAWIRDGSAEFTLDVSQAGTLCRDNHLFVDYKENDRTIKVKTINFSRWLANNFSAEDYIVIKMDIEGAEFELLDKMIEDRTDDMVNRFLIEFHERMFNGTQDEHVKELREYFGDRITGWY